MRFESAEKKIRAARTSMVLGSPFFGCMALRMNFVENNTLPTMATDIYADSKTIYYNTKFVEELSMSELKAVVAHEILHVAMCHALRRGHRKHVKWNSAGDFAINLILKDSGFELPTGKNQGLCDEKYRNMTAEQIYNDLPDPKVIKVIFDPNNQENPDNGNGENNGDPNGYAVVEVEIHGHEGNPCGGLREPKGPGGRSLTEVERAAVQAEINSMVAEAATIAKMAGKLPGSLESFIDGLLEAKIDWREQLRRFIERITKNDYSWGMPNRRYVQLGIFLPSLWSQDIGTIVVAIDTSGSVSNEVLAQFASEISAMLDHANIEKIIVLHCDTMIQNVEEYTREDLPLRLNVKGRGGTMFTPVFDWIVENNIDPTCLIYQTDLYCNDYPEIPNYPVMWVAADASPEDPPFGEVIRID